VKLRRRSSRRDPDPRHLADAIRPRRGRPALQQLLKQLGLRQPETARGLGDEAETLRPHRLPGVIPPSYGRRPAMEIVHAPDGLARYMAHAVTVSGSSRC